MDLVTHEGPASFWPEYLYFPTGLSDTILLCLFLLIGMFVLEYLIFQMARTPKKDKNGSRLQEEQFSNPEKMLPWPPVLIKPESDIAERPGEAKPQLWFFPIMLASLIGIFIFLGKGESKFPGKKAVIPTQFNKGGKLVEQGFLGVAGDYSFWREYSFYGDVESIQRIEKMPRWDCLPWDRVNIETHPVQLAPVEVEILPVQNSQSQDSLR